MSQPLHLTIPEPCHENWQQMTPNEQGRHCMSCQKTVVDFTLMSDQEVLHYISRASSAVCGRFNNNQLNKTYAEKKIKPSLTFRYAWNMMVAAFLLTGNVALAQKKKPGKKKNAAIEFKEISFDLKSLSLNLKDIPESEQLTSVTTLGFTATTAPEYWPGITNRYLEPPLTMFGFVRDSITKTAIGFARVRVKDGKVDIPANEDGRYEIPVMDLVDKVTLVVSADGYTTKEYIVPVNSFHAADIYLAPKGEEKILTASNFVAATGEMAIGGGQTMAKQAPDSRQPISIIPEGVTLGGFRINIIPDRMINGLILDDSTGLPVSNASVQLKRAKAVIAANETGQFNLVVPGKKNEVMLVVSAPGYATEEFEVTTDNSKLFKIMLPAVADKLRPAKIIYNKPETKTIMVAPPPVADVTFDCTELLVATAGAVIIQKEVSRVEKVQRQLNEWLPTKKEVRIYPNPVVAGNMVTISLDVKKTGEYKLELIDASGRLVYVQALQVAQKSQVVNMPTQSSWSRGVYWLRISHATEKKVYQAKVMLQ